MKKILLIIFYLGFVSLLGAQEDNNVTSSDSISKAKYARKKNYSGPRKASIMSAILPGLGQAYNKKYWKIPIIYVGLGGFSYMFITNNEEYNFYRKNLIAENDEDPNTINTTRYSSDQLQILKINYRKNRDFAALGVAILYILNIIDANVDAHLKTFDVSDDLSIQVSPWLNSYNAGSGYRNTTGISVTLNFK